MKAMELYALAREQCRRFYARERIFAFEKSLQANVRIKAEVKTDVRIAQSADISRLIKKFGAFGMREGISKRHLCFVAYIDGEIAHYKWVAFDEAYVSELDRKIHFDSNSAYIYSSYTVRGYRGLGLDTKVTERVFDYLYERGVERVYILAAHNNRPSLRVLQKVGYRKIGEVRFVQVFGLRKYTSEGVTAKDHNRLKEMFLLQ